MYKAHFLFVLLIIAFISNAQPTGIDWERNYGGTNTDKANYITATADGGFIVVGDTYSEDIDITNFLGNSDIWVIKLAGNGDIEWSRNLGGGGFSFGKVIEETSDGGYIVTGNTLSDTGNLNNNGLHDFIVIKLSQEGDLEWEYTYGGKEYDYASSIAQTRDGGYIVTGSSYSNILQSSSYLDILVIKLSSLGEVEWQNYYGGTRSDAVERIHQTADGGYILAGTTSSSDGDIAILHSSSDYWLVKLSASGDLLWEKTYGGGVGFNRLSDLIIAEDGGYVLAGRHGGKDFWIIKTDSIGQLEWQNSMGGSLEDEPSIIIQTRDEGFLVGGVTQSFDGDISSFAGANDVWLVKLDSRGEILWEKTYGGSDNDNMESIIQLEDDSYIMAGYSDSIDGDVSSNHGGIDFWIVKLFAEPSSTSDSYTQGQPKLYPNPVSELLVVDIAEKSNYTILNFAGQKLSRGEIESSNASINVKDLNSGTHFILLENESGSYVEKFIKE